VPERDRFLAESSSCETLEEVRQKLPVEFLQAIVFRELEGLSHKEISEIGGVLVGTAMSRLARSRARMRDSIVAAPGEEG
jgi:DNA-directed RNA polymerase specialized sigma24 family protein